MTSLSSCYFCGAAVGASLEEHSVPADAPADDQIALTLCSSCAGKLDQLLDQLPVVSSPSGASDDAPAPSELDVDPEIPGSDPDPIFADEEGTLLGAGDAEEQSAAAGPGSDVPLDDGADDAGSDSGASGSASSDASPSATSVSDASPSASDAPTSAAPASDDGESVGDSPSETVRENDAADDDRTQSASPADPPADGARADDSDSAEDPDRGETVGRGTEHDRSDEDDREPDGPASGAGSSAQTETDSMSDDASGSAGSPNGASAEESPVSASASGPDPERSQESAESESNARTATAGDVPDETRTQSDDEPSSGEASAADVSTRTYNRVVRLLQNREFPVDRTEFETLATSAYELEVGQVQAALDVAVEKGLLDERDGHLHRPE